MTKPPLTYRLKVRARRLWSGAVRRRRFAHFGAGSSIENPQMLLGARNVSIGDHTSIRYGARIEAHARFPHRKPSLTIGSNTNIEQNVHIMCQNRISIGDRVSITGHCAIVDVTHPVDDPDVKIGDTILDEDSYVEIGNDVFIGFGSVILPNVRIGDGAVIGANSVVVTDIPPRVIAAGAPARVVRERFEQ